MAAERWTYIGQRESTRGGLLDVWLDATGERVAYEKFRGGAIGSVYEVEVDRSGDSVTVSTATRFVEAADRDDARVPGWHAEHRAAVTAKDLRAAERRAAREGVEHFGRLSLVDLRDVYRKAPATQKAALLGQVLRYLGAA